MARKAVKPSAPPCPPNKGVTKIKNIKYENVATSILLRLKRFESLIPTKLAP